MKPKLQARVAAVLAVGLFSYPLLRALNLIPVEDALYFFADVFGDERAWSLESRLMSEVAVLYAGAGAAVRSAGADTPGRSSTTR